MARLAGSVAISASHFKTLFSEGQACRFISTSFNAESNVPELCSPQARCPPVRRRWLQDSRTRVTWRGRCVVCSVSRPVPLPGHQSRAWAPGRRCTELRSSPPRPDLSMGRTEIRRVLVRMLQSAVAPSAGTSSLHSTPQNHVEGLRVESPRATNVDWQTATSSRIRIWLYDDWCPSSRFGRSSVRDAYRRRR